MKEKEFNTGKNIYSQLRKNNTAVWAVVLVSIFSIGAMAFVSLTIYRESTSKLYTINNKGELIPLSLISKRTDKVKVVQSAVEYFVKNYFELDQYSIKDKKEKTLWLVGEQPTKILKDKDMKGYYSNFMTVNGLVQKAQIIPDSWTIRDVDNNPTVYVSVLIERINGENKEYYQNELELRLAQVNINYPYNPFGYLITNYAEQLQKVNPPTDEEQKKLDTLAVKTNVLNTN